MKHRSIGWVLVAPALALIGLFVLLPGVLALVGSLFRIDLGDRTVWTWAGIANYTAILTDPAVQQALWNTVVYSVLTIVPSLVLGLGTAMLAHSFTRGRPALQVLLFLPFATNMVAMAVVFRWIFASRDGVPAAVRTDRGVSVHRGESVSIGFNASDILLFDAETGARLPRDGAHAE